MIRQLFTWICGFVMTSQVIGGVTQFPYEAVVRVDQAAVRCGQGKNYYVTTQLDKGSKVTVYRHDPGGWSMISPPEGSFSWVAADQVRVETPGTGTVELEEADTSGAPIWIGSDQSNIHSIRQRVLRSGDSVQILGEETLDGIRYYKINPPAREFRWIKGEFLMPDDPELRQIVMNDPYANPLLEIAPDTSNAEQESEAPQPVSPPSLPRVAQREIRTESATADSKAALREIDRHYTEMMRRDPAEWTLDELVKSYQGLAAASPELAPQIQQRIAAIEPKRKLVADYQGLLQLSAETTARDQELAAQANISVADATMDISLGMESEIPFNTQVASNMQPESRSPVESMANSPTSVLSSTRMNGAGVVQRMRDGQYAITTPNGRLLAILQADSSAHLERMVGQSIGVIGERRYDPNLRADRIVVQQLVPVQLQR